MHGQWTSRHSRACVAWHATRGTREGSKYPIKQLRIDAAVRDTLAGIFESFRSATMAHKVSPQTVQDRAAGKGTRRLLINEAQEKVLVDWCRHNSDSVTLLHPRTLHETVSIASFPVTWTSLETFEADADARQERERLEKEKKAKGISDEEACVALIYNITMRTFDGPFTSCAKRTWKHSLGHSGSREMENRRSFCANHSSPRRS
ncbi:hypothetical protein M405DRAFT_844852 [Rhizopogon salebrosus TDB-379]|nr:hypothetical protein M405DRAFT_844852 [Rhizopogon salebrosus TDB-379]